MAAAARCVSRGRPGTVATAATAAGWDWAYVKAHDRRELIRFWIALAYAHGQFFMTPHPSRQWCFTGDLGTHWFAAPIDRFAPLYQFIRRNAGLFDDYDSADASGVTAAPQTHCTLRRKGDAAVVHVLNRDYQAQGDRFEPKTAVTVSIPKSALGSARKATVLSFDADEVEIPLRVGEKTVELTLPELRLWSLIAIR